MNLLVVALGADGHLRTLASGWLGYRSGHLHGRNTKTITIAEEKNTLAFALSTLTGLNPVAPACALPNGLDEAQGSTFGISAVVLAHDLLDSLGGFIGVVEWDCGHVVVEDVGLDDTVEECATNEAKLTVDGSGGATSVGPGLRIVMGKRRVGVLKEGNGDCVLLVACRGKCRKLTYQASGLPKDRG